MKTKRYWDWIVYGAGGVYAAVFLFSAALRLIYPYEVEWNEGAVLDHAIRLLDGKPIYTAPSLDFSAFVYTPFYYALTALIMKLGGIAMWTGRSISIAATIATAVLIGKIVQRETSSRLLAASGALLYIAFYHTSGFFYDIVRMDALAVMLAVAALYSALYLKRGYLIAAVLIVLAYFTKQQMLFIWPGIAFYLYREKKREALSFVVLSIGLLLCTFVILNWQTDGWFRTFTMTLPSLKAKAEFSWINALEFFPKFLFQVLGLFTLVIIASPFVPVKDHGASQRMYVTLRVCYMLAIASGSIGFGNPGGYVNVLMPLTAMVAILFPIAITRVTRVLPNIAILPHALVFLAFFSLAYNPLGQTMLFASPKQRHAGDEFIAKLRELPGDVWIPFHGYLNRLAGKPTHVHFMAMNDAIFLGDSTARRYQRELDSSLEAHRFASIILDEDCVFKWDSIPHYSRTSSIFTTPNVFISRIGGAATRPQFIYHPTP